MTEKLLTITVHDSPSSGAITLGGTTNLALSLASEVTATYRLGGVHKATMDIMAGSPFGMACIGRQYVTHRQAVKFVFESGAAEWWRIESIDASPSGDGVRVELWPYWTMLDSTRVRKYRGTFLDISLALVNVGPREALTELFSAGASSTFATGGVHPILATERISLEVNGETHLDGLYKILSALTETNGGYPAEFVARWVGATCYIDIVPWVGASGDELLDYVPRASTRLITGPTGAGAAGSANRLMNRWSQGGNDFFNAIIPVCGDAENRVTIAQATWKVAGYSAGTITLEKAPLASPLDGYLSWYFGNDDDGFFDITSRVSDRSFTVAGDASSLTEGRFAADADGAEIVVLATSSGLTNAAETVVEFPVSPYRNILAGIATISEDMSTWAASDANPLGMRASSNEVAIEKVADPAFVRFGRYGMKATMAKDAYVEWGPIPLAPTDDRPYFSTTVNAGLSSGRIRLEIIDANGVTWPTGPEKAESTSRALMALSVGGLMPAAGNAWVRIKSMAANTVVTVDSIAVTQSTEAQAYAPKMGLEDLWILALEFLRKKAGANTVFDTRFIDASRFSGSYEPVEIGSYVEIRDAWNGSNYLISETGRVQELVVRYTRSGEPFSKKVRVTNQRPEVTGRLYSATPRAEVPYAPKQVSGDAFESTFTQFIGGDQFGVLAQETLGGPDSVILVNTTFEIPYGTLLELRPGQDIEPVSFWSLNTVAAGSVDAPLFVSDVEPVYPEGEEGNEDAATNIAAVTFPVIQAGAGIYTPVASLVNTLRQTAAALDIIAKIAQDSDTITRLGALASDHTTSGLSTTNALTIAAPGCRVALRAGWQILVRPANRTTGSVEYFTVSAAVAPGDTSIPIVASATNLLEGDVVMLDPFVQMAFLRVEPTEIRQEVKSGRKGRAIVTLDAHAAGSHSVLEFEGSSTLGTTAAVGDKFVVVDDRGNRSTVYCNGTYDETATSMAISPSVTFTRDIPAGSALEWPDGESRSYLALHDDELNLRVEAGDVIAAINLIVTEEIDAARIEIAVPNIFLVGEMPSGEFMSSYDFNGTGGWSKSGAGGVTIFVGAFMLIDSDDGIQFANSQDLTWRDDIPNGNVVGSITTDFGTSANMYIKTRDDYNIGGTMAEAGMTIFGLFPLAQMYAGYDAGGFAGIVCNADGSVELTHDSLGFFGATAVAKPEITGSAGSNAALIDLLASLETLGLITDSST